MREKPAAISRSADIGGAFRQPPCGFAMLAEQQLFRLGSVLLAPMPDDACATTSRALAARSAAASLQRSAAAAVRTFAATMAARDRSPVATAEEPAAAHEGSAAQPTISSDGLSAATARAIAVEAGPLGRTAVCAPLFPNAAHRASPTSTLKGLTTMCAESTNSLSLLHVVPGLGGCILSHSLSRLLPPHLAAEQMTMVSCDAVRCQVGYPLPQLARIVWVCGQRQAAGRLKCSA